MFLKDRQRSTGERIGSYQWIDDAEIKKMDHAESKVEKWLGILGGKLPGQSSNGETDANDAIRLVRRNS